jgi:hypothetical protein
MSKKDLTVIPHVEKKLVQDTEWNGMAFIMAIGWVLVLVILFAVAIIKH